MAIDESNSISDGSAARHPVMRRATRHALVAATLARLSQARKWSLMRNSVSIMGATIVTSGLGYLYWMVAAHGYSAYEVGVASTLISAMALVASLSNLGLGATLIHLLPRKDSGEDWSSTLTTALVAVSALGVFACLLVIGVAPLILPGAAALFWSLTLPLAFTFGVGVVCTSLGTVLDQAFVAERASVNMLLRNTAFAAIKLVLIAAPLLFVASRSALGIMLSWVVATFISIAFALVTLIPRLRRGFRPTMADAPAQLRSMRGLLVGNHFINVGSMAPMYLLPVFVSLRLSVTQSAYFYTTWMLAGVVFMITPSIASSLFAEGSHDPERAARQAWSSLKVGTALLLPAIVCFVVFGRLMLSLFGHAYVAQGYALLIVLVVAGIPDGITNIYISLLRVRRRIYSAGALNLGMAACTLAGAWYLLPRMGLVGAGVAWLIAQSLGSLVCGVDLLRERAGAEESRQWLRRIAHAPRLMAPRLSAPSLPASRPRLVTQASVTARLATFTRRLARPRWALSLRLATWPHRRRALLVCGHAVVMCLLLAALFQGPHTPRVKLTLPAAVPPAVNSAKSASAPSGASNSTITIAKPVAPSMGAR